MHPPRLPLLFVPLPLLLLLLLLFRWQVSKTTAAVVPSAQSSSSACQSLWFCEKEISGTNLATTREIDRREACHRFANAPFPSTSLISCLQRGPPHPAKNRRPALSPLCFPDCNPRSIPPLCTGRSASSRWREARTWFWPSCTADGAASAS